MASSCGSSFSTDDEISISFLFNTCLTFLLSICFRSSMFGLSMICLWLYAEYLLIHGYDIANRIISMNFLSDVRQVEGSGRVLEFLGGCLQSLWSIVCDWFINEVYGSFQDICALSFFAWLRPLWHNVYVVASSMLITKALIENLMS